MTPEQLAKSGSERGEQLAFFQWASMAARRGIVAADDPRSYTIKGHAETYGDASAIPALSRVFAIHNQGHGDAIRGGRAKAEGVKAGVPDIMWPAPLALYTGGGYSGVFIEMKRTELREAGKRAGTTRIKQRAGEASDEQDDWFAYLRSVGYKVEVAVGWKEARQVIVEYLTSGRLYCLT